MTKRRRKTAITGHNTSSPEELQPDPKCLVLLTYCYLVTHCNPLKPEEREETVMERHSNTTFEGGRGRKCSSFKGSQAVTGHPSGRGNSEGG
jgi:hypothetical protein